MPCNTSPTTTRPISFAPWRMRTSGRSRPPPRPPWRRCSKTRACAPWGNGRSARTRALSSSFWMSAWRSPGRAATASRRWSTRACAGRTCIRTTCCAARSSRTRTAVEPTPGTIPRRSSTRALCPATSLAWRWRPRVGGARPRRSSPRSTRRTRWSTGSFRRCRPWARAGVRQASWASASAALRRRPCCLPRKP